MITCSWLEGLRSERNTASDGEQGACGRGIISGVDTYVRNALGMSLQTHRTVSGQAFRVLPTDNY